MKIAMPALRFSSAIRPTLDRRALQRMGLLCVMVLMIATTYWFLHAANAKQDAAREAATRQAWTTASPVLAKGATSSLDTVVTQWTMRREKSAEQTTLSWAVADARDLQASLRALDAVQLSVLDATQSRARRIDVKRREGGFTITAELSP